MSPIWRSRRVTSPSARIAGRHESRFASAASAALCAAEKAAATPGLRQIIDLLQDEAKRKSLGQAARLRLDAVLSWQVAARNLVTLMNGLVASSTPPAHDLLALDELQLGQRQDAAAVELESGVKARPGS